jgi:class 3 adenylate cyclase
MHVVDQGFLTGQTLTAEHKVVTILFADFAGFTSFLREREAEEVHDWLGSIWSRVDAIIVAHGGTVAKHIGDAIMALFGDQQAHEGDAAQAVRAGLAIQACIGGFQVKGAQAHLLMRMGIHTGRVVLEPMGSTREFRATGDAINLASHLEQSAPPGAVMISHDTFRSV